MIGLQLLFTYWLWMNQTFRSAPLDLTEWWLDPRMGAHHLWCRWF